MYIELEKAIEAVKGAFAFEVESPDNYREIAVETLKLLPSLEVVRCKDCEMWSDSFEVKDVGKRCLNFRIITRPDFYCAWGSKE